MPGGWWSPTRPSTGPRRTGTSSPACSASPWGAQEDAIKGAALSLEAHRGTTVVGEMGTGKTFIAAAAYMTGFKRILVLGPPHLEPKWKREVEMTVPGARAFIVKSITDLERLRFSIGSGPLFAVMSREKAKLSARPGAWANPQLSTARPCVRAFFVARRRFARRGRQGMFTLRSAGRLSPSAVIAST